MNITLLNGINVFFAKDKPTHHNHPKSTVYIKSHSWCWIVYGFVQMYNDICGSAVKNPPAAWEMGNSDLIPGSGRSPGEGNGNWLQYSCLRHPMDRRAWWATVLGVAKSQTQLSDSAYKQKGPRELSLFLLHEDTLRSWQSERVPLEPCWHPDLSLPASRTVRNECLLFSHPVYGHLYRSPSWLSHSVTEKVHKVKDRSRFQTFDCLFKILQSVSLSIL